MRSLRLLTDGVMLASGLTSLPSPPTSWGAVPQDWTNDGANGPYGPDASAGAVPELDLELWAAGTVTITGAQLVAAFAHPLASFSAIAVTPDLAVAASLNLATKTSDCNAVIAAKVPGVAGDSYTIAFVQSGAAPAVGALTLVGKAYTFTFLGGTTTDANFEAAVAASANLVVQTPGTGSNVLAASVDEFTATPLAGGVDTELNASGHGLLTGDGPVQVTSTGAYPTGVLPSTNYWVIKVDANNFKLATSARNAMSGVADNFTSVGSGTIDVNWVAATSRVTWSVVDQQIGPNEVSSPGTIALTATAGWTGRVKHRPRALAYGVEGSLSSGVAVSAAMYPIEER